MNREERMERDGLTEEPIEFYGKNCEHNYFSNFSPHDLWLPHPFTGENTPYKTGEHRYQAMKAYAESEHDYVLESPTPFESKERGRAVALKPGWDDWLSYYVMCEAVWAKAINHDHILKALLDTNERAIWEDSPVDDIWGIRYRGDYRGKNLLGKAWMQVRERIYLTMYEVMEATVDK
jgi:ribA/ribD-fused uncharacterized protein